MAYMAYEYRENEKIADIASQFNTTVAEIMKINHVNPPYPTYVRDLPNSVIKDSEGNPKPINVPFVTNGKQSFETYNAVSYNNIGIYYKNPDVLKRNMYENANGNQSAIFTPQNLKPGRHPVNCYISAGNNSGYWSSYTDSINGFAAMYFPCYPDSVSDSNQANYNGVSILGRSEPFQYYTGSGPRTVSASFKLHSDMYDDIEYIYRLAAFVEACCYPRYGNNIAATKVIFHSAQNIHICGIMTSVNTSYDGPILDMKPGADGTYVNGPMQEPKYSQVNISFNITEVTGNPPSFNDILSQGGNRNAIQ